MCSMLERKHSLTPMTPSMHFNEFQLPLWIAVSIRRSWAHPPKVSFMLFDNEKHHPATVNATINWEYDEPSCLRPFVEVILRGGSDNDSPQSEIFASVGTEASNPVFRTDTYDIGLSKWGWLLTTSCIYDACGNCLAKMKGWPFTASRSICTANGEVVARLQRAKPDFVNDFLPDGKSYKFYILESKNHRKTISPLVIADWICMMSVAHGTRPNASP